MPLKVRKCFEHKRIWWNDESFGSTYNGSLWEPQVDIGEFFFYHVAQAGHEPQKTFTLVGWGGLLDAFAKPIGFDLVWNDQGANTKMFSSKSPIRRSLWKPAAPEGYVSLGMVGLGAEWHCDNSGIVPTADDFPRFRCIKLGYLEKVKQNFLSYDWRWNNSGSAAKMALTLYNIVFKQSGLDEKVRIGIGVPNLNTEQIPDNDVWSFNPDLVTFDEKPSLAETPEEKLIQILGKAKAVYTGDLWHCWHHSWRYHHFILFSDHRLEFYKDNSKQNRTKTSYNEQTSLELRGSYELSAVSGLEMLIDVKKEAKYLQQNESAKKDHQNDHFSGCGPHLAQRNQTSFLSIKSLFGFEQEPTPYTIELRLNNGKPVKFAFKTKPRMKRWFNELKQFSIMTSNNSIISIPGVQQNSGSRLSAPEETKSSSFGDQYWNGMIDSSTKPPLIGANKLTFWKTVIATGMTFQIIFNAGVERCWNLYAGKDKDRIIKSELATLLKDYMETKLEVFPSTVAQWQAHEFLDNVGERALQAKKFLNTSQSGRVIFQEFKRIQSKEFWELMDEKKSVTKLNEAREMWKRILEILADYGFLGDDEVFEIWERYDSTESGTLTLDDVQEFLRDWIRAIAKLYPRAVGRKSLQNFLCTIKSRAVLASRLLDRTSEGVTFKKFSRIQDAEFWRHIDQMINTEIESPISISQADTINFSISHSLSKPSMSRLLSWSSKGSQLTRGTSSTEMAFPSRELTEASEFLYLGEIEATDIDLPEDPLLSIKLKNYKMPRLDDL